MQDSNVLEVRDLCTTFRTERGWLRAIDHISFDVKKGEILGLVGESGCGKSVTSQSILRLYDEKRNVKIEGSVLFEDKNILEFNNREMEALRGSGISMAFQDALSSLDPVMTIGKQIMETIKIHNPSLHKEEIKKRALEMLHLVGIPAYEERFDQYPHELSGGMRQRVMIAISLCCNPKVLIADEPTTALDVTIQAQIMDLILRLNKEIGMSVILITHDLGVVAETCNRVAVMYAGSIMETANVEDIFRNPQHPYTRGLIASIPRLNMASGERLKAIPGTVPALNELPEGCLFAPRCEFACQECRERKCELIESGKDHRVRCILSKEAAAS